MRLISAAILLTGMIAPTFATAQELTVEEILERMETQREIMAEAEAANLGRTRSMFDDKCNPIETRGLKLVPLGCPDTGEVAAAVSITEDAATSPTDPNRPLVAGAGDAATEDQPVLVAQFPPELQVNLRIRFSFDSAAIADSERPTLEKMCQVMQKSDLGKVRIVGHTDSAGAEDYNQRLSTLRAQEVARYLVQDCGISAARLETMGMGERMPSNSTDPAADENRRVEFQAMS